MMLILTNKKAEPVSNERVTWEIKKGLSRNKIKTDVHRLRDIEIFLEKKRVRILVKKKPLEKYNVVYFRKASSFPNAVFLVAETAKRKGIYFIDRFRSSSNTRGKLVQMFLFALNDLPIPKTYYSPEYDNSKIKSAVAFLKIPLVIKATHLGHGEMIYLAKNKKMLERILKKHTGTEMILQQFIPNDIEYRTMVLGKKVAVAEKKIRVNKKEFRSNSRFGAKEIFLNVRNVPKDIKNISVKAARLMDIQVAGVDIIIGNDRKNYLTEVNSAPGLSLDAEGSYELKELVKYLSQCAKKIL